MLTGDELMAVYQKMCDKYPIVTIEDPFDQVTQRYGGYVGVSQRWLGGGLATVIAGIG